jgi:type IV secretion system protein VirB10
MAEDNLKPKISRKYILIVFPIIMVAMVGYIFIKKGGDLGQADKDKEAAAKVEESRLSKMNARVDNPEAKSQEALDDAKKNAPKQDLPPPPSDLNIANINKASDHISAAKLEEAKVMIDSLEKNKEKKQAGSVFGDSEPVKPSFVAYSSASTNNGLYGTAKKVVVGDQPDADSNTTVIGGNQKQGNDKSTTDSIGQYLPNKTDKNKPFIADNNDKVVDESITTATRISGKYWLAPGVIIRAVLLGAVDTQVAGQVTARTTEPIYDSRYGHYLVIPVGSTLIGNYDSSVAAGQVNIMMAFSSLVTPAGGVVKLSGMRAGDALGRIGVAGELHTHFWERMGIATLMALESVGVNNLSNSQTTVSAANGTTSTTNNNSEGAKIIGDAAKQEITLRSNIKPNITLHEGQQISIITTGSIEIPPVANLR